MVVACATFAVVSLDHKSFELKGERSDVGRDDWDTVSSLTSVVPPNVAVELHVVEAGLIGDMSH